MVAQMHRKKSKRQSCRLRYKVEKKIRQHNKKVKKLAAKKTTKIRKKDPGVPNKCPFKEDILKEAEDRRIRLEEEREQAKLKRKQERQNLIDKKRNLTSLVSDAQKRASAFEKKQNQKTPAGLDDFNSGKSVETSRKAYYREFKKVISASDVILQVLDARDPNGSRCQEVEEAVINAGAKKRLVLVLNKIDLVPREIVEKWLKYLRNEFPTVAFKASTQDQKENLSQAKMPLHRISEEMMKSSRCLGADSLMKLLNNYARNLKLKTSISVGIVGFPNTGKSSIINSLKRSKACNVGATPGVTKQVQEVQLDKHIKLLDSPGVVMVTGTSDTSIILRNCVKIETLEDPATPVDAILKRCSKEKIMLHYRIQDYTDVTQFLQLMSIRFGLLRKGGVPDTVKAAKRVLQDWITGKITFYTHPPEQHTLPTHVSAEIVQSMAEQFDLSVIEKQEDMTLGGLKTLSANDIVLETEGITHGIIDEPNDDDEEMIEDEEESEYEDMGDDTDETKELEGVTVAMKPAAKAQSIASNRSNKKLTAKQSITVIDEMKASGQLNRAKKEELKRMKKKRKKADALGNKLSDALMGAMELGEDYDFKSDYK
ncbi:guanine nucleotide-binding protein-like 3 homolog [Tubulanus polymorphus]|uniref:guanine nucleotide-binding protein-like 3 homolog n=1 Tax=Tubulanus polymorphus TaxID=672921 RepID=UPI003DA43688